MLTWSALEGNDDGGAPILSYDVQWDILEKGNINTELVGYSIPYLLLNYLVTNSNEGIIPGVLYQFRYRARNKYGWGAYS